MLGVSGIILMTLPYVLCRISLLTSQKSLPFAFLLSPLEHVVRSDGSRILVSEKLRSRDEFKRIKVTMTSRLILLSAFWALWSFFYRYVRCAYTVDMFY